ncbi:MAG: lipopolysaccharide heptosyltransferase II [Nitrospinales bacterium]
MNEKKNHNILLWLPNWIGDVILSLPAIQALHDKFQDARITAVVKPPIQELLMGHPAIDSVIKSPTGENSGFPDQVHFARGLRYYNFDLGIVFPNSFRAALLMYLAGAKIRLGYNTEMRGLLLTHPSAASSESKTEHRVKYFFHILSSLGIVDLPTHLEFPIAREVNDSVSDYFSRIGINEKVFCIAVHPGGSKLPRTWHVERYGILCQKLIKEYHARIILLGNDQDAGVVGQIINGCPAGTVFSLLGLSLKETAAAIKRSRFFIGNDSGMMHMAAMVGTPLVGIFGPGNPATTGPYIDPRRQAPVTRNYPCSPCRQKFFKECKPSSHNRPFCIEDISVKDVMEAVEKIIVENRLK